MVETVTRQSPLIRAGIVPCGIICERRGGFVVVPVIVKPIDVPLPPVAIPVEVRDIQVTVRVAEMCQASSAALPLDYS